MALMSLSVGLVHRDPEEIALSLQDLGSCRGPSPSAAAARRRVPAGPVLRPALNEIPFSELVQEMLGVAIKYGIQVPPSWANSYARC